MNNLLRGHIQPLLRTSTVESIAIQLLTQLAALRSRSRTFEITVVASRTDLLTARNISKRFIMFGPILSADVRVGLVVNYL